MEMILNKKQLIKLLELYYKKYKNSDSKVTIDVIKGSIDYYEDDECLVIIKQNISKTILDEEIKITKILKDNEIKEALNKILKEDSLQIQEFEYDKGITSSVEGYGMGEHTEKKPYFNGIKIKLEKIEKEKQKVKKEGM